MTYRLDRGNDKKNKVTLAVVGGLFFVTIFFWPSIQPFLYKATEPVTKRVFELTGGVYIIPDFIRTYFSSRLTLLNEKKLLRAQIESLENRVAEQDARLEQLLGLFEDAPETSVKRTPPVTASSLARDVTQVYATLILSKGFGDGVEVGDRVYLRGRQVVCLIKETYSRTSSCELFSGFGNKIEGVTSSSSVNIILEGRGGHYIANIVRDTKVTVGEKVFLREDPTFTLGEVVEVFNNDQDTSWHILVRSPYNPAASSQYYIERPN